MSDKVAYVAANNEKDAAEVAKLFLSGDHQGIYRNGSPATHPDDIGPRPRARYKHIYRVVTELGHRGQVRYLVDRPDRPPYKMGDVVHALYRGQGGGTTLGNGVVSHCLPIKDRPGYWSVGVNFSDATGTYHVNGKGKDSNGYLKRGPMKR